MKHAFEYCQRVFDNYTVVAYFFNARGDAFEKTPLGMLRSLVFRLIDKEPTIYNRFVLEFRKKYEMHQRGWEWREPELKKFLLSEVQQHLTKPLVLLIDALDECSELDVRDVVAFLERLSVTAADARITLNICISSRHYPHISMKIYRELVVEEKKEHHEDIATYVRDNLKEWDQEIENGVLEKASGIFMWVVLVIAMLNIACDEGKVEAMQQTLREVPDDLDKLFWTILSKDNPDKHETILMLQWVLFAREPLKPEELYYATLAGTNANNLGAWDSSRITPDTVRRRIIHSSRGLIEVSQGERRVQFIHESVNDFLVRNRRLQSLERELELNPIGTSHDRLKSCCVSYMLMDAIPVPKDKEEGESFESRYPFLKYASTHFLDHAEAAEAGHVRQTEFLRRLREQHDVWERVKLIHNSFEQVGGSGCVKRASLLYMAVAHGYGNLVRTLLEDGADVNALGGEYGMALRAAAFRGHKAIVTVFLKNGADVNALGGYYGTALQAAAVRGFDTIITMFLKNGADVNALGGEYGTALQAAAFKGRETIVTMLLKNGADVNARGGEYGTALQAAAFGGHETIITTLLKNGADINILGGYYGTALQAAAAGGRETIVTKLLMNGADVNAEDASR